MRSGAAARLARLQHESAGRHEVGRGGGVDNGLQGGVQVGDGRGFSHRLADRIGERAVGPLPQPLGPASARLGGQCLEVDGGRRAVLLLRLDGHRAAAGGLEPEAHHGLVDRADLLDVEGAVGDALAVEHQQLVERAVDGAVRDEGRLDPLVDLARAGAAAFEEPEAVRVEQRAVAPGQVQPVGVGPVVEQPEQHQELRPGAVALVHGVRVERGVLAQAFVQAGEGVVARERLALRQQVALFGVEQEDEAQDDGEQCVVDVVGTLGQRFAQQGAPRGVVGGLEAAQQVVEGVQHLLGQPLAHLVLETPAVLQQRGKTLVARETQETGLAQQQPQCGHHGPAGGLDHVGHVQVEPAGALAAGRRDEPHGAGR